MKGVSDSIELWILRSANYVRERNILGELHVHSYFWNTVSTYFPMDKSSSIRHRFDFETPRGKFVEISLILKGESTRKSLHRFDVEISTWIRLSKSKKYRWVFHVDFFMLFRCRIDVLLYSLFPIYHFRTFSTLETYSTAQKNEVFR